MSHRQKAEINQVAWHIGHPLSQTLFTCLYIERLLWPEPKTLEEAQFSRDLNSRSENPLLYRVLRSYCIATIKACHFVHCMVTGESYYEVCPRNILHEIALPILMLDWQNRKRTSLLSSIIENFYPRYQLRKYRLY